MEKKLIISTEDQLLKARSEGLAHAREIHAMQAHGKYEQMDVFSWINPRFETLTTVLSSFPYPIIWMATQKQVRCALTYYPEVQDNIESVIVHDKSYIKLEGELISDTSNIVLVGDFESSIRSLHALKKSKRILLFTSDGANAIDDQVNFQNYIEQ